MDNPDLPPQTGHDEIRLLAASLALAPDGVELAYKVLDYATTRDAPSDACLVLHPEPMGPQIFLVDRRPASPAAVRDLFHRPVGLYTQPQPFDVTVGAALAGCCNLALAAHAARRAADEAPQGLASRQSLRAALARAAACAARYGWQFTAVLLATTGSDAPSRRWESLNGALRAALRSGDEAGVAGPGRAIVLLGNAGPDVVQPFVTRVREALVGVGARDVQLHVATARSPGETVDPDELVRLLAERLPPAATEGPRPAGQWHGIVPSRVELALRCLPGVVSVGTVRTAGAGGGHRLAVVAVERVGAVEGTAGTRAAIEREVGEWLPGAPVDVVVVPESAAPANGTGGIPDADPHGQEGLRQGPGTGSSYGPRDLLGEPDRPPAPAATEIDRSRETGLAGAEGPEGGSGPAGTESAAPAAPAGPGEGPGERPHEAAGGLEVARRVALVSASFDPVTGTSEVRLSCGTATGTGRASTGPLSGGALATLAALGALGKDVPFYLLSAERAHGVPGEPVVVVLAPRQERDAVSSAPNRPLGQRMGLAPGGHEVEAASRATLAALNRFLTAVAGRVPSP